LELLDLSCIRLQFIFSPLRVSTSCGHAEWFLLIGLKLTFPLPILKLIVFNWAIFAFFSFQDVFARFNFHHLRYVAYGCFLLLVGLLLKLPRLFKTFFLWIVLEDWHRLVIIFKGKDLFLEIGCILSFDLFVVNWLKYFLYLRFILKVFGSCLRTLFYPFLRLNLKFYDFFLECKLISYVLLAYKSIPIRHLDLIWFGVKFSLGTDCIYLTLSSCFKILGCFASLVDFVLGLNESFPCFSRWGGVTKLWIWSIQITWVVLTRSQLEYR